MVRMLSFASLIPLAAALPAQADEIHSGNWAFTTQTQFIGMPHLPPGMTLPPGVNAGTNTVSSTHNSCISADKPIPTDPRSNCTIEKNERNGGTVTWAATCDTPRGQAHAEGVATYSGDKMESSVTFQVNGASGQAMSMATHTTGRYLGACPD